MVSPYVIATSPPEILSQPRWQRGGKFSRIMFVPHVTKEEANSDPWSHANTAENCLHYVFGRVP